MSGVGLTETLPEAPAGANPFTFYLGLVEGTVFPPTPGHRLKMLYVALLILLFCDIAMFATKLFFAFRDGRGPLKSRLALWRVVHDGDKRARVLIFSTIMPISGILAALAILGVAAYYYAALYMSQSRRISFFWVGIPDLVLFMTAVLLMMCTAQAYILAKRRQNSDYWLRVDLFNRACIIVACATVLVAVPVVVNSSLRWTAVWKAWLTVRDELKLAATTYPEQQVDQAFLDTFMPEYTRLRLACQRYTKACRIFLVTCVILTFLLATLPTFVAPFVLLLRRSINSRKKMFAAAPPSIRGDHGVAHVAIAVDATPMPVYTLNMHGHASPAADDTIEEYTPKLVTPSSEPSSPFMFSTFAQRYGAASDDEKSPASPVSLLPPQSQSEQKKSKKKKKKGPVIEDAQLLAIRRAETELMTIAVGVCAVSAGCMAVVIWNLTLSYRAVVSTSDVEIRAILIPFLGAGGLFIGACVLLWARWDGYRAESNRGSNLGSATVLGSGSNNIEGPAVAKETKLGVL